MKIHDLKIDPQPFADLVSGAKTCEIRNDDRGFEVGDMARFPGGYTRIISHIQRGYGLPDGLCVLSYAQASAAPEQEAVAEVRYMGYEPTNHLNWLGKNDLQLLKDGTKLYTHPSAEIERLRAERDSFQRVGIKTMEKLADAQALLRRVQRHGPANVQVGLEGDIDAFLSATAQPAEVKS